MPRPKRPPTSIMAWRSSMWRPACRPRRSRTRPAIPRSLAGADRRGRARRRIVAITAAMPSGTGLDIMASAFPSRVFDVGIAEQHARDLCRGHGSGGAAARSARSIPPSCSAAMIRSCMTWRCRACRCGLPSTGRVWWGPDGATHAGAFDIGYLANLPGFTVMAAGDEAELVHMVATAAAHDAGPIAFRYPRGEGVGVEMPSAGGAGDRPGPRACARAPMWRSCPLARICPNAWRAAEDAGRQRASASRWPMPALPNRWTPR